MSRISNRYNYYRTNEINTIDDLNTMENRVYNTAIYARISVDNGTCSIENQINLAKEYINYAIELKLIEVYVDNGYSGVNYNRKGYRKMINDIDKGKIDCVVVKDISRISRNYLDIGKFIEEESITKNARIIAINDGYDSDNCTMEMLNNIILKNIINEIYIRDTSRKIKKSKEYLRNIGVYTGVYAPYGYKVVSIDGKRKLEVKEESYRIVKKICDIYDSGVCYSRIADYLFINMINNKISYRKTNKVYADNMGELNKWSIKSIKDTIERERCRDEYSYIL